MNPHLRKGIISAAAIHLLIIGVALFFAFWEPRRETEPEPMTFEMMPPPSGAPAPPEPAPEPEPQAVTFEFEEIPVPEPEPRPPPPEPEPPPPEPEPPPQPEPPPPPPPEPTPEPAPEPEPEPEPPPERVRFDDFRRENPRQERQRTPPPEPAPRVEAPRIDTSAITEQLRDVTLDQSTRDRIESQSPEDQNRMAEYFARLRSEVRGAWEPPPGLPSHLEVRVQFSLSADGRISNVRVVSPSGNRAFDDSVVAAFRRLGSTAPTPNRQSYAPSLRFGVD